MKDVYELEEKGIGKPRAEYECVLVQDTWNGWMLRS
jgi:hypothetical protein